MDTREVLPHGSPSSFAGRAWPAALPRRPSGWLLLLALPFWVTVWCLNLPTRTCCHRASPVSPAAFQANRLSLEPPMRRFSLRDHPRPGCLRGLTPHQDLSIVNY
jgi:hypothetical protein